MIVYLAGPMRKYEDSDYNFAAFYAAAAQLRLRHGFTVINPAERDVEAGDAEWDQETGRVTLGEYFTLTEGMRRNFALMSEWDDEGKCQRIILLPGWRDSAMTKVEIIAAEAMGMEVWEYVGEGAIRPARLSYEITISNDSD